jgi:hypothetical protein
MHFFKQLPKFDRLKNLKLISTQIIFGKKFLSLKIQDTFSQN